LTAEQIDLQEKKIRVVGGKGMKDRIAPLFSGFKKEYLVLLPIKIKRTTLQSHFKTLCKKVLNKDYHFHQLRHGFAIMSIKQGVPLPYLQSALGHSRLDTTGIYTQSQPEDMLNAYKKAWGEI
jgi:site-specific recombinase XerD